MTKKLPSVIFPILLILLVPLLAFWQATFGVYAMKWDIMDQFFPCRYFISECFKNGILPYWCPYIHLGYPMYADPQAGLWYPISFLLAATVGYNVYTIQFEFALHLVVAAWGMYLLLRTLGNERVVALVIAVLFPLSGFFVSHSSHLTWIISVAWLPWVFNYYLQGLRQLKPFRFVQAGFFLALCLTGGYVIFTVLACYSLAALFLYHITTTGKSGNKWKATLYSLLVPLSFLLLSSGYISSLIQSLPYLKRAEGLTLEVANINPFSPASFLSFLFPFSTTISAELFNTDMTMRNLYMGLLMLPVIVLALINGHTKRNLFLLTAGVFCLLAAMGAYLPVRGWLYQSLPFMKMFRHTAIFRSITLLCFLIVAADGLLVLYTETKSNSKKILAIVLAAVSVLVITGFAIAAQNENIRLRFPDFTSVNSVVAFLQSGNIYQAIIVQSAFQGLFLALLFAALLLLSGKRLAMALSVVWIADVALAAQINTAGTVVSAIRTETFHNGFKQLPKGFPNPGQTPVANYNQYGGEILAPVVYNASMLRKEPCADGFNAFCLKDYMTFFISAEAPTVLAQPLVYFSDEKGNPLIDSLAATSSPELTSFTPNRIEVKAEVSRNTSITLLQAHFPGWNVTLNGKHVTPAISKQTFMTIPVSAGKSNIVYQFRPPYFSLFASVQILSYLVLLLLCIRFYIRNKSGQ